MADNRSRRRRWALAAALLVAALLVDTVVWAWACRRLSAEAPRALAAAGWTLAAAPVRWAGWPVAAEIVLDDAALRTGPDLVPPLAWTVPQLRLRLPAWSPTRLELSADGGQTLAVAAAPPVPFAAHALTATIDLLGRDPPRVDAAALEIGSPGGPVRVETATLTLLPGAWSADLAGLVVPGPSGAPVAPPMERVRLHGRIDPAIPDLPTPRQSAAAWRARDGHLAIGLVELRWGAVSATGDVDVTLDAALQPAAAGQLQVAGLAAGVSQLAASGAISPSAATATGAVLAILAAPSGGGPVPLPLTLRDGVVSIARIPLIRLLPLDWGPA